MIFAQNYQVHLFTHLHSLSLRWHISRKTGAVLRMMDKGSGPTTDLLSQILFNVLPQIADMGIAVIYFTVYFNFWMGLVICVWMVLYSSKLFMNIISFT